VNERRYQVFVSSTKDDLREERQASVEAILNMHYMPVSTDFLPAATESEWQQITGTIATSDYYVLILAGCCGPLDADGVPQIEREYRYARSANKHILPFLHEDPRKLPREKTEQGDRWKAVIRFREELQERHTCMLWQSSDDLQTKLTAALTAAVRKHPTTGWVRADTHSLLRALTEQLREYPQATHIEAHDEYLIKLRLPLENVSKRAITEVLLAKLACTVTLLP